MTRDLKIAALLGGMALAGGASAQTVVSVLAEDSADDPAYAFAGFVSGTNGGSGYEPWTILIESTEVVDPEDVEGFAGTFVETFPNPISTNGASWGTFANNGSGREAVVGFRSLSTPITPEENLVFELGFVNRGIADDGGRMGFSLRSGTADGELDDIDSDVLIRFELIGVDPTEGDDDADSAFWVLTDALGTLTTPIPFSFDGVQVRVVFTDADTYNLEVFRFIDNEGSGAPFGVTGRRIESGLDIASFAVFNDDNGSSLEGPENNGNLFINSPIFLTQTFTADDVDVDDDGDTDADDTLLFIENVEAFLAPPEAP